MIREPNKMVVRKLYIADLDLSGRTLNILEKAGIEEVSQLADMQRSKMFKYRNVGEKTVDELDRLLKQNGLSWKYEAMPEPIHIAKEVKTKPKRKYHNLRGENDKLIAEVENLTDQILKSNLERVRLEGKVQELEEQIRNYTTYLK